MPKLRGFAAMDKDIIKEIARLGGKAAHVKGTAHKFTSEEARVAGKKGGIAPHKSRGGRRKADDTVCADSAGHADRNGEFDA